MSRGAIAFSGQKSLDDLRQRFDAIKASVKGTSEKGRSDLEAALSFFGVIERPAPGRTP